MKNSKNAIQQSDQTIETDNDIIIDEVSTKKDSFENNINNNEKEDEEMSERVVDPRLILTEDNFTAGGLRHNLHGPLYQLALLILVAYRANKNNKEFSLISEAQEFEKFDDLVIEDENGITFLQAKHTIIKDKKYKIKDFCDDEKSDVSLAKYFDSWYKLRERYGKDKKLQFILFFNHEINFIQKTLFCSFKKY